MRRRVYPLERGNIQPGRSAETGCTSLVKSRPRPCSGQKDGSVPLRLCFWLHPPPPPWCSSLLGPTSHLYGLLFIPYPLKKLYILSGRGWGRNTQDKMYKVSRYVQLPGKRNLLQPMPDASRQPVIYSSSAPGCFVVFCFFTKKHLFLTVLGAEKSKFKVPADLLCSESLPPGSYTVILLLCTSQGLILGICRDFNWMHPESNPQFPSNWSSPGLGK